MELFNEMKNSYYVKLVKLINVIIRDGNIKTIDGEKRKVMPKSLINEIFNYENQYDSANFNSIISDYIMDSPSDKGQEATGVIMTAEHDDSKIVYPLVNKSVSVLPDRAELAWLKTALKDEKAKLFFTEKEYSDLVDKLNDDDSFDRFIKIYREDIIADNSEEYLGSTEIETMASKLNIILKCIHDNCFLEYSYSNGKGKKNKKTGEKTVPYKIEYSVTNDTLMLCHKPLYLTEGSRPIKSDLRDMFDLKMLEVNPEKPNLKELVEERKLKELLVIRILPDCKKEVLKRILIDFAKYKRGVKKNDDGGFTISIECYTFQENDLINEIISFGPQLVVESPKDIRDEIIKRITDPYSWASNTEIAQ